MAPPIIPRWKARSLSLLALVAATSCLGCGSRAPRAYALREQTLHTVGANIVDTCGAPWRARGMEQLTAKAFAVDGSLLGLARELADTGANAVRLLPQVDEVSLDELDAVLTALRARHVVVYLSPGDRTWFARPEVVSVLRRHEAGLILDAFQEPNYHDVPRWLRDAKAAIHDLRASGYVCPLTVMADSYGRNLSAVIAHGQEVVDSDPRHNVILGWQAYWGEGRTYASPDGMSLSEGVRRAAALPFPVQLGIDAYADPNDRMDYQAVMAQAERQGLGWLWWNFWNRWDSLGNNASADGTARNLTPAGKEVIEDHPGALRRTAHKACFR